MRISTPDDKISVPTVCGNVATIYGPLYGDNEVRAFEYSRTFANYGSAKLWADEFLDNQRNPFPRIAKP